MGEAIHRFEKRVVTETIIQYYFVEDDTTTVNNIYAFIDKTGGGARALIIDTGYPEYSQLVKKDLDENGIKLDRIVLSHFHPDHSGGCSVFPEALIYVSRDYEDNFFNCQRWKPNIVFVRPANLLKSGDAFDFGSFRFRFTQAPGHSQCSLITAIGDDILHIGDLLMFDDDGKLNLPYIATGGGFKKYIQTLENLKGISCSMVLIPHSNGPIKREKMIDAIDHYIYYLKKVVNSKGNLPLAVCLKEDISVYAHPEFHDTNLIQLMMEP